MDNKLHGSLFPPALENMRRSMWKLRGLRESFKFSFPSLLLFFFFSIFYVHPPTRLLLVYQEALDEDLEFLASAGVQAPLPGVFLPQTENLSLSPQEIENNGRGRASGKTAPDSPN